MNFSFPTVTFLFTDIEGSTRLWEQQPEAMRVALARHDALLREAIELQGGQVFKTVGDAFCAAFSTATAALNAALSVQRALQTPLADLQIRVRTGLHTGEAEQRDNDYFGNALNRVARLMSAGHGGQILLSHETASLVRDELPADTTLRDMGKHRLKGLAQLEHLFQVIAPDLPADFPKLSTLDISANNLPTQLSSFIGREKEVSEVKRQLSEARLVTLTGSGGCGKTRLAIEAASGLQADYANGVWLIELAPLADPALVPGAVAATLGLREEAGGSIQTALTDFLRARTALLILDNCEHLIEACAQLSEALLRACPRLRILASSREALGITGEVAHRVPSLTAPDLAHLPALADLIRMESVRLFVERAATVKAGLALTEQNARVVAQICKRLDGIPLAIELAASRMNMLSVEQIAQRLDDRFRFLTGGSRTALPRQQTLRAMIDWSYSLLSESERKLFCRLAVFVGGWTLEAAEAVGAGEGLEPHEIFDLLTRLVDKSLVIAEEREGEVRYGRLETIRQYAREKLLDSGEGEQVRQRHLAYFLRFAENGDRALRGAQSLKWTRLMDLEHNNLRAALEFAFSASQEGEAGLQLANALAEFWGKRSYFSEQLFWLEKALDQSRTWLGTPIRAKLLYHYGVIMTAIRGKWEDVRPLLMESLEIFQVLGEPYRDDYAYVLVWLGYHLCYRDEHETGHRYLQEAIHIFQETGDKWGHGWALNLYSEIKFDEEDVEAAYAMAREGISLYRESGDRFGVAICLSDLGDYKVRRGSYGEGQKYLEEALGIYRDFANKGFACQALKRLGDTARGLNDYEKAEPLYRESLSMRQEAGMGSGWFIQANLDLGYTVLHQGEVGQAITLFTEALELSRKLQLKVAPVYCLAGLAAVLAVEGKAQVAARLYGAVEARIQSLLDEGHTINSLIEPIDRLELDRYQSICRAKLDETTSEKFWVEGRAMTLDEAAQIALEEIE